MNREQKAIATLTELLKKGCEDICGYCKYEIPCPGKKCERYIEGIGDAEGKHPDLRWSCLDFDYGFVWKG